MMCEIILELYPHGDAEDESANALIRRHFWNRHTASLTPYLVMP